MPFRSRLKNDFDKLLYVILQDKTGHYLIL